MKCPLCGEPDTRVIDSRPTEDNSSIRRRRQCEACGKRFTTYEKVETLPLMVIKRDNTRAPYDRTKIEAGVLLACHKRPVSAQAINRLVDNVETKVFANGEREVSTKQIGQYVMEELMKIDEVAYVRFASVYRSFTDVDTFLSEIDTLKKKVGQNNA
ncbi:MAG: transcriptional repressor NrdR [Lachnospiraceae bacterium]|nr:transcriptional repressor NrdR [Lachnospiraceae bacterium]MBQ1400032.1 transcriptional repressor NrdR [Lachnospiraceae bacterium]MBR0400917.1 transcriptional repressor NrdR [Lachnospiraceae bacterium]MBR2737665.1 transcriptional repressor NrdR [Lachnospiraceae bacterium]MCR5538740.1 transcriptional regulator NrdR [Lachnospiraceae bacterium]